MDPSTLNMLLIYMVLLSISYMPHIALVIALFILLKIVISFSLNHHVPLLYNIADLKQLL